MVRIRVAFLVSVFVVSLGCASNSFARDDTDNVILVYHRFAPVVNDSMTVTTAVFKQQIEWLAAHKYRVVPLRALVEGFEDRAPGPGPTVALTADDGHRSVFTEMFPLLQQYGMPVTLFIYPSAISNASYALTWEQLGEMVRSGLVEVQSHTYWHPNFKTEAARLRHEDYEKFVANQLTRSKESISAHLGVAVDMLAWPFGIHDPELEKAALHAGYIAGFTLERRHVRSGDDLLALPRYLLTDLDRGPRFAAILERGGSGRHP